MAPSIAAFSDTVGNTPWVYLLSGRSGSIRWPMIRNWRSVPISYTYTKSTRIQVSMNDAHTCTAARTWAAGLTRISTNNTQSTYKGVAQQYTITHWSYFACIFSERKFVCRKRSFGYLIALVIFIYMIIILISHMLSAATHILSVEIFPQLDNRSPCCKTGLSSAGPDRFQQFKNNLNKSWSQIVKQISYALFSLWKSIETNRTKVGRVKL